MKGLSYNPIKTRNTPMRNFTFIADNGERINLGMFSSMSTAKARLSYAADCLGLAIPDIGMLRGDGETMAYYEYGHWQNLRQAKYVA